MGGKRKKEKYWDYNASIEKGENYGTLFPSMLKSEQYKSLTIGERHFYNICRVHWQTKECQQCLYNHKQEFGTDYTKECFVFPSKHLKRYGIDRANASRYFDKLVQKGFIEKVESNKSIQKVNVYKFSRKWKDTG